MNDFDNRLQDSAWAKRVAQEERRLEMLARTWDAIGAFALLALPVGMFYLKYGFSG